jgi:predicted Zn-dependent peptidase
MRFPGILAGKNMWPFPFCRERRSKKMRREEEKKGIRVLALGAVLCTLGAALCAPAARARVTDVPEQGKTWKNRPEKVQFQLEENDRWWYIYHQDTSSEITVVQILVKGGKRAVPVSQRGLAFLTTGLSVNMPTLANVRELMHMGSTVFYHVEGDYSGIRIESLSANAGETLKIVSGVMQKPLFSGLRIGNTKRYMENRQKGEEDSPERLMERTYLDAFFGPGGGYAGSINGDAGSRKKIKRKHILQFYKRFFNRSHMIIAVSSNLGKPGITRIMEKYFTSLPPGDDVDPAVREVRGVQGVGGAVPGKKTYSREKDTRQVLISFGALLPGMSKQNYAKIYMLDNLLGKGPGSKLWPLRVKKDLAYNITSHFTQWQDAGVLIIYLKTTAAKKEGAYTALKEVITGIYKNGITQQELDTTVVRSRADFLRQNETKLDRVRNLAYFEALGVGFDFLETFFSRVNRVTLEEFNGYIKDVLQPGRLVEVIIGPGQNRDQDRE